MINMAFEGTHAHQGSWTRRMQIVYNTYYYYYGR